MTVVLAGPGPLAVQAALAATVLAALVVRSRLGFGFSLTLVPLGAILIGFEDAVLLAIALEVVSGLAMAVEHRRRLRLLDATLLKACSYGGLLLGVALRGVVSRTLVIVVSMATILATCLWLLMKGTHGHRPRTTSGLVLAGSLSGLLNSWTSLSGPPVVFYYLRSEGDEGLVKGALTGYFVLLYMLTFATLWFTGGYHGFHYWPAVGVGSALIAVTYTRVRALAAAIRGDFQRLALGFIAISAVLVVAKEVLIV